MKTPVELLVDELTKQRMLSVNNSQFEQKDLEKIINSCLKFEKDSITKCCMETMKTCSTDMKKLGLDSMNDYFEFIYNKTFNIEK